jgi:YesN/AraC family two-component response regulator
LSNAIKFTGKGQTVNASIALKNDNIQLEVRDTGRGIHPDDIPHLFNRYFQTKDGTSAAEGGTGIGLSLCHEYAKLMGGDIGVESTQGKGTVFSVWFPVVYANGSMASTTPLPVGLEQELTNTESTVPMQDAKPPRPASRPGSHKLLIVEDSPDLRKYIRELLEEQYEVLEARNGKEALKKLSEHSDIHLILSDLMMPEMDGYELLKRIKEDQELFNLPFIMLTARADSDSRLNALRVGVDDYLTKPFEEAELLARIKNLLKNYQARTKASASTEAATEENVEMISIVDREWLQDFEAYILDNLSSEALSVPELAAHFAMSESTLRRRLQQLTGLSTKQYLQEVRLNKARQLFEMRTHKTVSEVAKAVGYTQLRSFSRIFKERFGKTPSSYLF